MSFGSQVTRLEDTISTSLKEKRILETNWEFVRQNSNEFWSEGSPPISLAELSLDLCSEGEFVYSESNLAFPLLVYMIESKLKGFWSKKLSMKFPIKDFTISSLEGLKSVFRMLLEKSRMRVMYLIIAL